MTPGRDNVVRLEDRIKTNQKRIEAIKRWHMDKVLQRDPSVAIIHIDITEEGLVNAEAFGVEPEHLSIFVEELDRVRNIVASKIRHHHPKGVRQIRPHVA